MKVDFVPKWNLQVSFIENDQELIDRVWEYLRLIALDGEVRVITVDPWLAEVQMLPGANPEELITRAYNAARDIQPNYIDVIDIHGRI